MRSYKIHLICHGLSTANEEGRYAGVTDVPLSESGRRELQTLGEQMIYPSAQWIVTSPLQRAVQTAELLFPEQEIRRDKRWQEMNFGVFENKTPEELQTNEAYQSWLHQSGTAPPEGESAMEMFSRVMEGFDALFSDMMQAGVFSAAVITHRGILSGILATFGLPRHPPGVWSCSGGEGYTLLLTPQMWLRDRLFEIYQPIPAPAEEESGESI